MRYIIILMLIFSCGSVWCVDGYFLTLDDGTTVSMNPEQYEKYKQQQQLERKIECAINEIKELKKVYIETGYSKDIKETLDKIYSMVADLEVKFMGQERYNQIYDPTNEGEVAKQKRYDEKCWKEINRQLEEINKELKRGNI